MVYLIEPTSMNADIEIDNIVKNLSRFEYEVEKYDSAEELKEEVTGYGDFMTACDAIYNDRSRESRKVVDDLGGVVLAAEKLLKTIPSNRFISDEVAEEYWEKIVKELSV